MLFYSFFKTLVGKKVTVELKNDLKITVRRLGRERVFFSLIPFSLSGPASQRRPVP